MTANNSHGSEDDFFAQVVAIQANVIQTKEAKAILEKEQQITFRSQLQRHFKQIIYSSVDLSFFYLVAQLKFSENDVSGFQISFTLRSQFSYHFSRIFCKVK